MFLRTSPEKIKASRSSGMTGSSMIKLPLKQQLIDSSGQKRAEQ
jgi:hypothetical protein